MTLANRVTLGRLGLTAVSFALLMPSGLAAGGAAKHPWIDVAAACFLVAVLTDWLDGYLARTRGEVTEFGRIADPFVDKIAICGAFVFFLSFPALQDALPAWMVVVVIAREFLVHGLRTAIEARGIPFGASFWGKQKMFLQSVAAVGGIVYAGWLAPERWAFAVVKSTMWVMLVSTVLSGLVYLKDARRAFAPRGA